MVYKLIFITNYLNPHTLSLCDELYKLFNNNFLALETGSIEQHRNAIGWTKVTRNYADRYSHRLQDVLDANVVIFGGLVDATLKKRINSGKLTFMQSERPYKIPTSFKTYFKRLVGSYLHFKRYQCGNFYMLALGGYVKQDMDEFNNFNNKIIKFGYFPQLFICDPKNKKETVEITWCGRMLDWKHPELALDLCEYLNLNNVSYHMNIIGSGPLYENIYQNALKYNDKATICESVHYQQMQQILCDSDICIVTSDRYEGWGVIVNEAMHHGCVVIANCLVGSTPYLIRNGFNGFIYESKEEYLDLGLKITKTINNYGDVRKNAIETIDNLWSSQEVALRLFNLVNRYLDEKKLEFYDKGPLSLDI